MRAMRIASVALAATLLAACATPPPPTVSPPRSPAPVTDSYSIVEYYVDVEVAADGSGIEIKTDTTCTDPNAAVIDDCVEVAEPDYARFNIELVELDGDNTQDWRFYGMVICRYGQKDFKGCALNKPQRLEFVATATGNAKMLIPSRRGYVMLHDIDDELAIFQLWDMNNLQRQFEYGIMVCPVNQTPPSQPNANDEWPPCLIADPRVRNKGRGPR